METQYSDLFCGRCQSKDIKTRNEDYEFDYGLNEIKLTVNVPVRRCNNCDYEFLDFEADIAKTNAVNKYLMEVLFCCGEIAVTSFCNVIVGLVDQTINGFKVPEERFKEILRNSVPDKYFEQKENEENG